MSEAPCRAKKAASEEEGGTAIRHDSLALATFGDTALVLH
jgi:hypothetical protein